MKKHITILIVLLFISSVICIAGCKGKSVSEEGKITAEKTEEDMELANIMEEHMTEKESPEEIMKEEGYVEEKLEVEEKSPIDPNY